jgi:hypothetical protein
MIDHGIKIYGIHTLGPENYPHVRLLRTAKDANKHKSSGRR